MAEMYMKNIKDWRDATILLTFEEKGYFQDLLDLIYLYDNFLPDSDELICKAMPVSKTLHKRLKKSLIEKGVLEIKNNYYFNKRCTEEIEKINKISEKNSKKSEKRWKKSEKIKTNTLKNKKKADAAAMLKVNSERYKSNTIVLPKNSSEEDKQPPLFDDVEVPKKKEKPNARKCQITKVLPSSDNIPDAYLEYATDRGIRNIPRMFEDWHDWWNASGELKAGAKGWLLTWQRKIRTEQDKQSPRGSNYQKPQRNSTSSTFDAAAEALARHRAEEQEEQAGG